MNKKYKKLIAVILALVLSVNGLVITTGGGVQEVKAYNYVQHPHAKRFAYHDALIKKIEKKHHHFINQEWIPVNCYMVTQHSGMLFKNNKKAVKPVPRGAQYKVIAISVTDPHAKYKIDNKHYIDDIADGVTYGSKQNVRVKRIKLTPKKLRRGIYKGLKRIGHRNGNITGYRKAKFHRDFDGGKIILDTSDTLKDDVEAIEDVQPEFEDYGYHKAVVKVKIKKLKHGRVRAHVIYRGYKNK